MSRQPPMARGRADDFQTPPAALDYLVPYLPNTWTIWECAAGAGLLVDGFAARGYRTVASDILTGQNFLTWRPEEHWDCVVTNPPYSLKQEFMERAWNLGKPFALLLPLTTFETRRRQKILAQGVEVIFLGKRVNFVTPSGEGSGAWFAVAWFTWRLGIGRQLLFPAIDQSTSRRAVEGLPLFQQRNSNETE